jgi:hypothetical protein
MIKKTWYATYTRWLQTHSNEHVEYEDRKHYPWHVLSRFNFNPASQPFGTTAILNQWGRSVGSIDVIYHWHKKYEGRHQYDIALEDLINGTRWRFRIVFSDKGLLITIYELDRDFSSAPEMLYIQNGPEVLNENPSTKLLKKCFHQIVHVALEHLLEKGYDSDVYVYVPRTNNGVHKKKPKRLLLSFVGPNDHWILFLVDQRHARSLAQRLAAHTNPITILYAIPNCQKSSKNEKSVQVEQLLTYEKTIMPTQLHERYEELLLIYKQSK